MRTFGRTLRRVGREGWRERTPARLQVSPPEDSLPRPSSVNQAVWQGGTSARLLHFSDPDNIGIDKEEEHQRDGHQVHVEAQQDAAVVEAPASLHAAHGVGHAQQAAKCGQQQQRGRTQMRGTRNQRRDQQAGEHNDVASSQRTGARIEQGWGHAIGRGSG
jgi:hypothetical protein